MSLGQSCIDLAEHFLSDVKGVRKEDIQELAEELHRRCEDACREIEGRPHPQDQAAT
jgi:hypothetical protein